MRAHAVLVLLALLLAQVPWVHCHCEETCRAVAPLRASACSCHHQSDGDPPGEPQREVDHSIVMVVALAAGSHPAPDAPDGQLVVGMSPALPEPLCTREGAARVRQDPGTGPPGFLEGTHLLL